MRVGLRELDAREQPREDRARAREVRLLGLGLGLGFGFGFGLGLGFGFGFGLGLGFGFGFGFGSGLACNGSMSGPLPTMASFASGSFSSTALRSRSRFSVPG